MVLRMWETFEYTYINIILTCVFIGIFIFYGIISLRKKSLKKYLIHLGFGVTILVIGTQIVNFISPKNVHMYYKYERNSEIVWTIDAGWEIVEHYGNKNIVHFQLKGE